MHRAPSHIDWPHWQPDIHATLMFVIQDQQVLLIEKLTGIGKGKINGPGGKLEPGETPTQAVIRECQEELHITPQDPTKVGELHFAMTDIPDIHCHVFTATHFTGQPTPTREANPRWTPIAEVPYADMWADDIHWLPRVLQGDHFDGKFIFQEETIQWMQLTYGAHASEAWRQSAQHLPTPPQD